MKNFFKQVKQENISINAILKNNVELFELKALLLGAISEPEILKLIIFKILYNYSQIKSTDTQNIRRFAELTDLNELITLQELDNVLLEIKILAAGEPANERYS